MKRKFFILTLGLTVIFCGLFWLYPLEITVWIVQLDRDEQQQDQLLSLYQRASYLHEIHRPDLALIFADKALKRQAGQPQQVDRGSLLVLRAEALKGLKRYMEARSAYEEACRFGYLDICGQAALL